MEVTISIEAAVTTRATQMLCSLPQLSTGLEDWDGAASIPHAVLCPWTGCRAPKPYPLQSGPLVPPYSSGYPATTPHHQVPWCHHVPCSLRYLISPASSGGVTYPSITGVFPGALIPSRGSL